MNKALQLALILTAYDRATRVINDALNKSSEKLKSLKKASDEAFGKGAAYTAAGAGILASLAPVVSAYSELEDASTSLKTAMMEDGGRVSELFEQVNGLAIDLGNALPGTTADFQNMFEVLLSNGVPAKSLLDGTGKAAAYLAVALKMPFDEAGKLAAKLKEATGTTDKDMTQLMDTIARVKNMGVETGEMQYAFGRSAGALKLMNIQGLEASKSLAAVYASLIRAGMSGETVGTGFSTILSSILDAKKMAKVKEETDKLGVSLEFMKNGKFAGIENMIGQLDKLKGFSAEQRAAVVNALTGGGQDAAMLQTLISGGVAGFNKMQQQMAGQATLNTKVEAQLSTLKNIWDSTTGTITNMMAALGEGIAPALKVMANLLGSAAGAMQKLLSNNPAFARFLAMFVAGVGVMVTVIGVINMVKGAFIALRVVMMANPFILIATVAIAVIALIYANWDKIVVFFKNLWEKVKQVFKVVFEWAKVLFLNFTPYGLIFKYWDKIVPFFKMVWEGVKKVFTDFIFKWAKNAFMYLTPVGLFLKFWQNRKVFFDAGANVVKSIWEGIKAFAAKPVEAISNIVKSVREYLPFSPAKRGPLRDIHRIKLVETIAGSIKASPLIEAVSRVTQAAVNFVPRVGGVAVAGAGAGIGGGSVSVNFSPTINIGGTASGDVRSQILSTLREYEGDLLRMIQNATARNDRKKY
jgi:TP901 family phage tail tape measure protein